ncbi:MAG: PAS domain S-box protein [Phycisphaerae bacterium]|nr:PAS domain S-box protein [Phycisphaerae bacterium]
MNKAKITERNLETIDQLRESVERFRSVIENSEAGYFMIDKDGIIQDVNGGWLKMYKYASSDEVIGKHFTFTKQPEDKETAVEFVNGIMNNDPRYMGGEFSRKCKDGSTGYHRFSARPVIRDGKTAGIEGFIIDSTKAKEDEQERKRLMEMLRSKNEELQSIVYISSHDLRGPLVNINGFSGSLANNCAKLRKLLSNEKIDNDIAKEILELIDETIPEDLLFITEGTKKMKTLIDGLLQVSRVGTVKVKMENLDMNEVIENIIANVSYRIQQIDTSITLHRELPPCYGDNNQINQLFSNLIDNAIKYLDPNRKGEIHISGHCEFGKSHYCVKDNGIGIQENHQKKIFEVYNRLDPEGSVAGEGLGLTIIKRILDRHNGTIWLESRPGVGSEFLVTLPSSY